MFCFPASCCYCSDLIAPGKGPFCSLCLSALEVCLRPRFLRLHHLHLHDVKVMALYEYDGIVKKLVHCSKIGGVLPVLDGLLQNLVGREEVMGFLDWGELLVPCHSSLYSRVYGRIDVPSFMAATFSNRLGIPRVAPPGYWGWHWKKRSRRSERLEAIVAQPSSFTASWMLKRWLSRVSEYKRVIILDDVASTGYTIATIAGWLHLKAKNVRSFVIASPLS